MNDPNKNIEPYTRDAYEVWITSCHIGKNYKTELLQLFH